MHACSTLKLYLMMLPGLQSMTEALETEVKSKVSIKVDKFFHYTAKFMATPMSVSPCLLLIISWDWLIECSWNFWFPSFVLLINTLRVVLRVHLLVEAKPAHCFSVDSITTTSTTTISIVITIGILFLLVPSFHSD